MLIIKKKVGGNLCCKHNTMWGSPEDDVLLSLLNGQFLVFVLVGYSNPVADCEKNLSWHNYTFDRRPSKGSLHIPQILDQGRQNWSWNLVMFVFSDRTSVAHYVLHQVQAVHIYNFIFWLDAVHAYSAYMTYGEAVPA